MPAPDTVQLCADTEIGPGAVIEPYVVLGPGVRMGAGAVIHSFSHLERRDGRSRRGDRPVRAAAAGLATSAKAQGRQLRRDQEHRCSSPGAKASHLSYLGDATVGAGANIGAGTITCNYDGFAKHATRDRRRRVHRLQHGAGGAGLGRRRAPFVAAGSTITRDVPDDGLRDRPSAAGSHADRRAAAARAAAPPGAAEHARVGRQVTARRWRPRRRNACGYLTRLSAWPAAWARAWRTPTASAMSAPATRHSATAATRRRSRPSAGPSWPGDLEPEALAITLQQSRRRLQRARRLRPRDQGLSAGTDPGAQDPTAIKNLRIAYIRRAAAAARLGDQTAALADYDRAIELEPTIRWPTCAAASWSSIAATRPRRSPTSPGRASSTRTTTTSRPCWRTRAERRRPPSPKPPTEAPPPADRRHPTLAGRRHRRPPRTTIRSIRAGSKPHAGVRPTRARDRDGRAGGRAGAPSRAGPARPIA